MSSTELVPLVNPATGEVVTLDSATDLLAQERKRVVELKRALDQYASHIDDELTRRLDRMGRRSVTVGEFEIETKAPTKTDYDLNALLSALQSLVGEDLLEVDVIDEVLVPVEPRPVKLNRTRLSTLLKHPSERVRDALAACAVEVEQRRTVTVR